MVENAKIKKIQMQVWVIFKQCEWYEKCRISKKCLEHQDGRLNIYSFSLYEPHDFLTNVYFLMTFYWNEEFTKRPFVKYVPYYYIWYFFLLFLNTMHLPFFVTWFRCIHYLILRSRKLTPVFVPILVHLCIKAATVLEASA